MKRWGLRRRNRGGSLTRLQSDARFAALERADWAVLAPAACRIAVTESGLEGERLTAALHALERGAPDAAAAASMLELADSLDEQAWDAEEAGADEQYDLFFRRSRAASALGFALSGEPDEAIFEAGFALATPEQLVERLERLR